MKTLNSYVLCEECKEVMVKKVYLKHDNRPLCGECRSYSLKVRRERRQKKQNKRGGSR